MKHPLRKKAEALLDDFVGRLPWNKLKTRKKRLRTAYEALRRGLSVEQMVKDSDKVMDQIEVLPEFVNAKFVLVYFPIHHEISVLPLVQRYCKEKVFLFPVTHADWMELRPFDGPDCFKEGKFGVPEPQTETYDGPVDLILVPGVAFDSEGHRLGRGGGFYDRFLSRQRKTPKIGIGYDFQLQHETLPHGFFDIRLDGIITPSHSILE